MLLQRAKPLAAPDESFSPQRKGERHTLPAAPGGDRSYSFIVTGFQQNRHENCPQKGENCALKLYKFFAEKKKAFPDAGKVQSKTSPPRGGGSAQPRRRGCSKFATTSPSASQTAPLGGEPFSLRRDNPSGAPRQLPLTRGAALDLCTPMPSPHRGRQTKKPTVFRLSVMERVTRLELATSTLARWRSTG